ncbi:MAG TPA: TonB-dependent receptor [Novosphingobium sp.]|nr:TonB-dependent receptor [Novosphingobium sp.]
MAITPAQADEAVPASNPASAPGDIVVTAQHREQKLNDVGIAVSVLGAQQIKNLNITSATDIVRAIPNLHFNAYGSSQVVFNIRGVSQNDYGDQQEPPVAVYQDDSYSSSITTASFPIFDLARTEVLRGPQGTLFGRNATGGAVQFISAQPTDHTDGYLSATYGSYNQRIIEGALSGRISDTLTARIAGQYDRDDGYIRDITPGQPNRGADNHWALRGILKWEPTDDFKARLTVRYAEADHERQAGNYTLSPACPNAQGQGEYLAVGQACSFWGTTNGGTANGYVNPSISPSQGGNPWTTAGTGDSYVNRQQLGISLRLEGKIGAFDVTSITDYQHLKKFYTEQGDGDPEQVYTGAGSASSEPTACISGSSTLCYPSGTVFNQDAHTSQFTQELRAATNFGHQYLTFGAFGMVLDGKYSAKYATPFDGYDPQMYFSQRTESFAFFAQDEWKISDQWKLIGGLRYWHDHKVGNYSGCEYYTGLCVNWGGSGIGYVTGYGSAYSTEGITATVADTRPSFSGVTARAEVDYKPARDTLIYASYNRGSKSGGFTFSTGTPYASAIVDTLNNIAYKPETLDDYEVGLKTKIGRVSQLNLAAFYYDYHNYQAYMQVGYTQVVRNLPATVKGIEAEFTTRPIRGLTFQANGALQESLVKGVLLPDGITVVNHAMPQAPGFSGSALIRYEFALLGGTASGQFDASYTGKTCFTVMCAPVEEEPAYHVENLRIGFTPAGGKVDAAFFINNLLNRAYRSYAFDGSQYWGDALSVYAKPRTWGVTLTYHLGR